MTEVHTSDDPAKLTPREARAATPVKGMPYVLGISITAVIVLAVIGLAIYL